VIDDMGKLKKLSFILLINLISVSTVKAADIFIDTGSDPSISLNHRIIIRGQIVRGDYEKLINVVKKHGSIPDNIFLNSRGGDVIEAMKIGRFATRALLTTGVIGGDECQSGCVCYSACMLIHLLHSASTFSISTCLLGESGPCDVTASIRKRR